MKDAIVVIGANYGDEGKGLMTDYFARQLDSNTLVIRFNGGAQAGHTVVDPDGRRHVFSHFGAGTMAGCDTLLTDQFIVNPHLFVKESAKLTDEKISRRSVWINSNCRVTTPYDMLINQIKELIRGDNRHGSCGVGIFETIDRCALYNTNYGDIFHAVATNSMKTLLSKIRDKVFSPFMKSAGDFPYRRIFESYMTVDISEAFTAECAAMIKQTMIFSEHKKLCWQHTESQVMDKYQKYIFESAQGLLLSERHGQMPHCTPSNPGMSAELHAFIIKNDINIAEVCYVSRAYMTRHGAGPLTGECDRETIVVKADTTNVTNESQGSFRYAPLDLDSLYKRITLEQFHFDNMLQRPVKFSIAYTCVDHLIDTSQVKDFYPKHYMDLWPLSSLHNIYISTGPTHFDVRFQQ